MEDRIPGDQEIPGMFNVNGRDFLKIGEDFYSMQVRDGWWQKARVLDKDSLRKLKMIYKHASTGGESFSQKFKKSFSHKPSKN